VLNINGILPSEGASIEMVKEHHKLVYTAVAMHSLYKRPHWRIHSITDSEGNTTRQCADSRYGTNGGKGSWHCDEQETIKNLFDSIKLEEFVYAKDSQVYKIADCYDSNTDTVIEIQHSPMNAEELIERYVHYTSAGKKLCFILSHDRAFKGSKDFEHSSFNIVENDIVNPVYVSTPSNTFFDLSLLKAMNLPVFVDIGWKDYYLQLITVDHDHNRKSYKYAMFFKLVHKKDIISITQTPNLYDTLREGVTKHWPFKKKVVAAINDFTEFNDEEIDKWSSEEYISSKCLIGDQKQFTAALSYLGIEEDLPLSDFKNKVEKAQTLKYLVNKLAREFTYSSYKILEAPEEFENMFRGYVYNHLRSNSKEFKRLSRGVITY